MCRVTTLKYTCDCIAQHVLSTCLGNKRNRQGQVFCKVRAGNKLNPKSTSTLVVHIPDACAPCQKSNRLQIIKTNLFDKIQCATDARTRHEAIDDYDRMTKEFEEMCPRNDFAEKSKNRPGLPPRQDAPKPSPLCEPAQDTRRMLIGYQREPMPPRKSTGNLTLGLGSLIKASAQLDQEDKTEGPKLDPRTYEQLVAAEALSKARQKLVKRLARKEKEKRGNLEAKLVASWRITG